MLIILIKQKIEEKNSPMKSRDRMNVALSFSKSSFSSFTLSLYTKWTDSVMKLYWDDANIKIYNAKIGTQSHSTRTIGWYAISIQINIKFTMHNIYACSGSNGSINKFIRETESNVMEMHTPNKPLSIAHYLLLYRTQPKIKRRGKKKEYYICRASRSYRFTVSFANSCV